MATSKAERLAGFISALSSSERNYFRARHVGGGQPAVYLEIFDYLDSGEVVTNDDFAARFEGRDFMRNPASALHYLEGLLCASLEQYHRHRVGGLSLVAELQAAKALLFRGFNKAALKRFASIEKRAEQHADWTTLGEALQWKSKAIAKDTFSPNMLLELIEISRKRAAVLRLQEVALEWETKHVELVLAIFNKGTGHISAHLEALKVWLEAHAHETEGNFEARYFELWIHGRIAKLEGDLARTHRFRAELLAHVGTLEGWPLANGTPYVTILTNLGASAMEMSDIPTFERVLRELKGHKSMDPDQPKLARALSSFLQLSFLVRQAKFAECRAVLHEAIRDYRAGSHLLVKMNQAVVLYYFAFIHLVNRNYREAHRWFLQVAQEIDPGQHLDVVCASLVLRLVAYYETGSQELLRKSAGETLAFLRKHAPEKLAEQDLCRVFMGGLDFDAGTAAESELLRPVLARFGVGGQPSFHQRHLKAWLVARVERVPYAEALLRA